MKQSVECPQQILNNYGHFSGKLSTCCDYIFRLSGFPDLSGKVFLITFKFSWLGYSTIFGKSNANKQFFCFLVSLEHREIKKLKTVTLSLKDLKVKKEAGTNFVLLC